MVLVLPYIIPFAKRFATVERCEGEAHEVRAFSTFCPKALNGRKLAAIDDMLTSRSVVVPMMRATRPLPELRADRDPAGEDLRRQCARWRAQAEAWLKNDVYPVIGERPVKDVGPADVLDAMRRFEERGARTSAERLRSMLSRIFRYTVRNLRADSDPAHAVKGAVTVPETKHHPTFKLNDLPAFLEKVEAYPGRRETYLGMRLLLITFVRKTELANAEWSEIDPDAAEWRIPARRMKTREEHVVPLSTQSVETFKELKSLSNTSQFVFPNRNDPRRPMGPSRFNDMIRAIGYTGIFSPHGARSLASTALNELGWRPDAVERQLAHAEQSKVRAAYNRAEYLDERREMMQQWADMVDAVAQGDSKISVIKRAVA